MTPSVNDTRRDNTQHLVSLCLLSHFDCYSELHYAERRYAMYHHAEFCYADSQYAECCYTECHYVKYLLSLAPLC